MRLAEAKRIHDAIMCADWATLSELEIVAPGHDGALEMTDEGSLRGHRAIATVIQAERANLPNPEGVPVLPGETARRTEKQWWT